MKGRALTLVSGLVISIASAALGGQPLYAADQKEEYVSTAKQKRLLEKALPGVEGKQITIVEATFAPGWIGEKHYHGGPLYVYVLEGSFTIDEQGKGPRTLKAGDLYEEPIGTPMQARNVSTSEHAKLLLIQVGGLGEPMMYKAQ